LKIEEGLFSTRLVAAPVVASIRTIWLENEEPPRGRLVTKNAFVAGSKTGA
jgi:hypothetical protein